MSKKKIAPMVAHAVENSTYPFPGAENGEAAQCQFRALLRVARVEMRDHGWTPGATPCRADCRRCRAFAALYRASGAPRRKP